MCAADRERDPFGPPPKKTAIDLVQCLNGHKTLKDVQIFYGLGAGNSPEVAAKVERGEAILGGCIPGRDHWVICRTCGLRFDDDFDSWRDDRSCSIDDLRLLRSPVLQGLPIADADEAPRIEYFRWYGREALQGERVSFWTKGEEEGIVSTLARWVPRTVQIVAPKRQSGDRTLKSWKWVTKGKSFELNYLTIFGTKLESHLEIEWHGLAEAGTGQPATRPESKSEGNDNHQPQSEGRSR